MHPPRWSRNPRRHPAKHLRRAKNDATNLFKSVPELVHAQLGTHLCTTSLLLPSSTRGEVHRLPNIHVHKSTLSQGQSLGIESHQPQPNHPAPLLIVQMLILLLVCA